MITTVVPDKAAGDVFTEAMWDTFIKDNLNNLSLGGTSLPASPIDGRVYHYVADATDGIVWQLRYRAASASAHKWEFIGGPPIIRQNTGINMTTASATFVDLTTVGPEYTIPRAGDYMIELDFIGSHNVGGGFGVMAVKRGAAATVDTDGVLGQAHASNNNWVTHATHRFNGLTQGMLLKCQYRSGSGATMAVGNGTGGDVTMTVRPIRVS